MQLESRSIILMGKYLYLETNAHDPSHDPVIGPDQDILQISLGIPPSLSQGISVKVDKFKTLDTKHQTGPVKTVHKLQLDSQIFLGQMIQHPKML